MKGTQLPPFEDPFADAPANNEPEPSYEPPAQSPAPVPASKPAVAADSDGKLTLTFKGAGNYSDRWLVAHVATPAEGLALLRDPQFKELLDYSRKIGEYDSNNSGGAQKPAGGGGGGGQRQSSTPQAAKEAPGGEKQYCEHGEMEYKSGVSKKSGKPYALFSCTAPRDQQCDAKWPAKR